MKTLIENNGYQLRYDPNAVNRYKVFKVCTIGISGDLKFYQEVAQSPNFTKKIKAYFTPQQINMIIAKVHAIKYVNGKFKS